MAVLQPNIFDDHYYADPYNIRSPKSRALAEENTGEIRLTDKSYDLCWAIAKVAWEHPQAAAECREGDIEKPIEARMRNGLTVRSKQDIINCNGIYDLKTLGKPMCFFRDHTFALGYHIQVGFYTGVSIGARDTVERDFKFWVVTKTTALRGAVFYDSLPRMLVNLAIRLLTRRERPCWLFEDPTASYRTKYLSLISTSMC
jgi:hypothetical protein